MRKQHDAPGRAAPRRQGHDTDTRIVVHRERTRRAAERFFDREARQQEVDQDAQQGRLELSADIERCTRLLSCLAREVRLVLAETAVDRDFDPRASARLDHALTAFETASSTTT